ncbi:MAG TPA: ATP-binding protein [Kineosporiaceae bacterium]
MLTGNAHRVLLVHGRRGLGKTALLQELASRTTKSGGTVLGLTAPTVTDLEDALRDWLGTQRAHDAGSGTTSRPAMPNRHAGPVLIVDDADTVQEMLRSVVLPRLPATSLVVLATSDPPSPEWEADLGWRELVRRISLQPLDAEAGLALLAQLGVPAADRYELWTLAGGHPLTLALLAPHWSEQALVGLMRSPDLVDQLLDRLVRPPDQRCGDALFVCAHASSVDEDILRHVLATPDVSTAWTWLCSLGVAHQDPFGLHVTPVIAELAERRMFQRAPRRACALNLAIHEYARRHLSTNPMAGARCLGPVRNLFAGHAGSQLTRLWRSSAVVHLWPRRASVGEIDDVVDLFSKCGEPDNAERARSWLMSHPVGLCVAESDGRIVAAAMNVTVTPESHHLGDPVLRRIRDFLDGSGPARPFETVQVLRFVADVDGNRDSPEAMYVAVAAAVVDWLAERPSLAFVAGPFDRRWRQLLADLTMEPVDTADTADLFVLDFRRLPADEWFEFLYERGTRAAHGLRTPPRRPLPLSHDQFSGAVQEALRNLHQPHRLADNPLISTMLVGSSPTPVETLRHQIVSAARSIGQGDRARLLAQILELTYLQPARSQKAAARALDLPISTFRRYLRQAVGQVAEVLWANEIAPPPRRASGPPER